MSTYIRRLSARRAARAAQIIGLCRFSYPALDGFKTGCDTSEGRAGSLYAPERLDERFRLFEMFTLPSLRTQTNEDFTFLIVIGEDFPAERRAQLESLTSDMPQVVIQAHPPGPEAVVMARAIGSVREKGRYSIQFRLDDDDAMGVGFVHKVRNMLEQHFPLFEGSRHVCLDFTRGWNAMGTPEGIIAEQAKALYLGVAFAIVFRPDTELSVMDFARDEVWQHMPTITRTDPDMWIRGLSRFDPSGDRAGQTLKPLTPEQEARFERAFGVTAAWVRARAAR